MTAEPRRVLLAKLLFTFQILPDNRGAERTLADVKVSRVFFSGPSTHTNYYYYHYWKLTTQALY